MKRKHVAATPESFPESLRHLLKDHALYDSSCSPDATVWFLDGKEPLYLKSAASGNLQTEAALTRYFHSKQLSAEVLQYFTADRDWLLTRAIPGEDCTFPKYRDDPKRLCETTAVLLRQLHEETWDDCPAADHSTDYLSRVRSNHQAGFCDLTLFPEKDWGFSSPEEAWSIVEAYGSHLKRDTLLHGDYCLPNILLDDWKFSGFIDVGRGGVGDRHVDIFWGVWTLFFNLKTNAFCNRFLDAYGRDRIQPEMLRLIAACEVFL